MSPAEYGAFLASLEPPLTEQQVESAARILASPTSDEIAA
jgi:hypothetical protein